MTHDVFEHDHGIVDDEAGADGQRHKGKIVDTVADQIHRSERADDRQRQGHRRYPHRTQGLQEDKNHRDHQHHGDGEGASGVFDCRIDGLRAVHGDVDVGAVRQSRLDRGQDPADFRVGFDDVGARDWIDDDADCRLAVVKADIADILVRIFHFGDIVQQDRRPFAVGDDEVLVVGRDGGLIVGRDLVASTVHVEIALGAVCIGGGDRGPHVLHADAVTVELVRFELYAD